MPHDIRPADKAAPRHTCGTPTRSIIANQLAPNSRVSKRRHCALCQIGPFKADPTLASKIIVRANGKPSDPEPTIPKGAIRPRTFRDAAAKRAEVETWLERRKTETSAEMGLGYSTLRNRWAHELGYEVPFLGRPRGKGRGPYFKLARASA